MARPLPVDDAPHTPNARQLLVTDGEAQAARPQLGPQPPYLLMTHPRRWTVIDGKVVPLCGSLHLRNSVHLVKERKDGRFMAREAIADRTEHGWTVIPQDVDGGGTSYLKEVMNGVWLLRWQTEHAGTDHVSTDQPAYATWLRGLIAAGKIPGPQAYILDGIAAKLRQEADGLRDTVRANPSQQPKLDRVEADLRALDAEIDALNGGARVAKPAGKPTKRNPIADDEGAHGE